MRVDLAFRLLFDRLVELYLCAGGVRIQESQRCSRSGGKTAKETAPSASTEPFHCSHSVDWTWRVDLCKSITVWTPRLEGNLIQLAYGKIPQDHALVFWSIRIGELRLHFLQLSGWPGISGLCSSIRSYISIWMWIAWSNFHRRNRGSNGSNVGGLVKGTNLLGQKFSHKSPPKKWW